MGEAHQRLSSFVRNSNLAIVVVISLLYLTDSVTLKDQEKMEMMRKRFRGYLDLKYFKVSIFINNHCNIKSSHSPCNQEEHKSTNLYEA